MATVRDIAAAAGVSVGTASRALTGNGYVSEDTRKLVLETAKQLGYTQREHRRPAASSKSVGVILPDITFPFYGAFLKYIEVELASLGYKTFVCNSLGIQDRVSEVLELLEKHELDGLILNADVTEAEIKRMEKLPVVSFERLLGNKIPMVSSDHIQGGRLAAKLLLDNGCKRVLLLTAKHANGLYGDLRISECAKILKAQGVTVTIAELSGAMLSYRYARGLASEFLSLYSQTDGIFTDDIAAYCCMFEAPRHGKEVPDRLKIVGYDGIEIMQLISPRITTIAQDVPQLTHACVDVLMKRMEHMEYPMQTLIPVSLQPGETA